jgi:hypothetical protein
MVLSLASIHQPLNDFFLNQFQTEVGSPIVFRFDKFGSVLSDSDFIDRNHPELGYLPALAMEKFSDLVNHIPVDLGDSLNILLSVDSIDTTYFFRLLSASIPYLSNEIDDTTKQVMISSFSTLKRESLNIWNNVKAESLSGLMLQYKPSLATPEDWYDMSKNEVWTSHSLQVTETSSEVNPGSSDQLWRLKLNDAAMQKVLQLPNLDPFKPKLDLPRPVPNLNLDIPNLVLKLHANPIISQLNSLAIAQQINSAHFTEQLSSVALYTTYFEQYRQLDVSKRIIVSQYLGHEAPTQTVKTNNLSISFDYCLVSIRRPWYVDAFINEKSWCIPTVPKGQVTASGLAGSLPLLPIGFVAIRNLNIEADWATEDVTNASTATDFGPFKVTTDIVNNKLSHLGLQIVGWILQRMPDLPPNDPPN